MVTKLSLITSSLLLPSSLLAQNFSLNYENLSSLEQPLAIEIGDVTFSASGLIDTPLTRDFKSSHTNLEAIGNLDLNVETQLSNRWNITLSYFAQYETGVERNYTDNVAGFIGGSWGTLAAGNLSGFVREQTRRMRGTGNAALAFDNHLGQLDDQWSAGYTGMFGPSILTALVDDESNFETAATFQRPLGDKDYRVSFRYTNAEYTSSDGSTTFDTDGISTTGQLIYGSTAFDVSLGYEDLSSSGLNVDRWYTSAGVSHKVGAVTVSLEGHYGELDGQEVTAASVGARYDIARGLSANLGFNYQEADVTSGPVSVLAGDGASLTTSLRYSF